MSFRKEDGVSSLCQKALHIITELCFAGQVEWDKCSGIFPADRSGQGGGGTGKGIRLRFSGQGALGGWGGRLPGWSLSSRASGTCLLGLSPAPTGCLLPGCSRALSPAALATQGLSALACPAGCSRISHSAWQENLRLASRNLVVGWRFSPKRRKNPSAVTFGCNLSSSSKLPRRFIMHM